MGEESNQARVEEMSRWLAAAGAVAVLAIAVVSGVAFSAIYRPDAHKPDQRAVALAESLATARAESRANLEAWKSALEGRDTVTKTVVRYIRRHDTAWRDTGSLDTVEIIRWLALSDSTQRVRGDSLAGELVQCRYDADQCADELAKRPTTCNGWTAFGIGVGVGAAASAAACLTVR